MHGYIFGSFLKVILLISHSQGEQEVHQNYINGFSKKNLIQGNWVILGPKMMHRQKFWTMKGAKSYMKIILMVFQKIFFFGENAPF